MATSTVVLLGRVFCRQQARLAAGRTVRPTVSEKSLFLVENWSHLYPGRHTGAWTAQLKSSLL